MIRPCVVALIAIAASGCKGSDERKSIAGTRPATTTTPAGTAGSGSATAGSATAGSGSGEAATPEMRAFCIRNMQQIKKCFDDDAFWDAHATTYFAATSEAIEPERKARWIGMYKDSFVSLERNREIEHNCEVMLEQNLLPTQQQMELVDQARQQSCAAFGGALGYVLFSEGAFYRPRDGAAPPPRELMSSP